MATMRFHTRSPEEAPRLGDYMKTPNGRTAYHVVGIRPGRTGLAGVKVFAVTVEKLRVDAIPDHAMPYIFHWLPRGKKKRA